MSEYRARAYWRTSLYMAGALLSLSSATACRGELLSFTFHDTAGDPRDKTDVIELYFRFDNQTGDFDVQVTTDPLNPFDGRHLLYLSVFNPDSAARDPEQSFFSIGRFGFFADSSTTALTRSGNSPVLTHWRGGDRVASHDVLGAPPGFAGFYSVLGGNSAGFSDSDEILDQSVIIPVPEPTARLLLLIGVTSIMMRARTRLNGSPIRTRTGPAAPAPASLRC